MFKERNGRHLIKRAAALVCTGTLGAAVLAGCTTTDTSEALTLQTLQDRGYVTVGFAGEAPYSFEKDGKLTGGTIALHREIFKRLGVDEVRGVKTDWAGLIPGLNAKRFDLVSAGMSILPERCAQAAFSIPEINYTTAFMVKPGNPKGLTDMDSVKASGATLATVTGAIESGYAKDWNIDSTMVATQQDGLDAVTSGRVDAFAYTAVSQNYLKDNPPNSSIDVTKPFIAEINGVPQNPAGATVFRKADTELLKDYNEQSKKIMGDKAEYMKLLGPFGFTEENIPDPSLTTAELCKAEQ